MKFSTIVLSVMLISSVMSPFGQNKHQCYSAHKLVKAINVIRQFPKRFADQLKRGPMKGGSKKGESNDPNCYGEAYGLLMKMTPMAQFKESLALDLASLFTTYKMATTKQFSHNVAGTNPWQRMDMFASAKSCCGENIAWGSARKSCFTFANMWYSDCGVMSRGHRKNIIKVDHVEMGAGVDGNYATMQACKSITVKTQYVKDYKNFGIFAKYDHKKVPKSAIKDDFFQGDFA
jgi:hypothetical protein